MLVSQKSFRGETCGGVAKGLLFSQAVIPWVPEAFLAYGGNFRCWPKADISSAEATSGETFCAGHYKDLTETGNRARKVPGTQGKAVMKCCRKRCLEYLALYPANVTK